MPDEPQVDVDDVPVGKVQEQMLADGICPLQHGGIDKRGFRKPSLRAGHTERLAAEFGVESVRKTVENVTFRHVLRWYTGV